MKENETISISEEIILKPEEIVIDEFGGQVREAGINSDHVQDLVSSIKALGQKVPVHVEEINGVYTCLNGHHRIRALREIEKPVKAVVVSGLNSRTRTEFQLRENQHLPAKVSTIGDIVPSITKLVKNESACGNLSRFKKDSEKIKEIKKLVEKILPGDHRSFKIAKRVFRSLPNTHGFKKMTNYTNASATEKFNELAKRKIEGSGIVDEAANEVFYFADKDTLLSAQWSLAQTKKFKNPNLSVSIVTWLGNPEGKSVDDVRNHRAKVVKDFKNRNAWVVNGPLGKVVEKIYFLPQILQCPDGNADVMSQMAHIKI